MAQTFSPSISGSLTSAQIDAQKSGTAGSYIVSINAVSGSGFPNDTVLASTTVADSFADGPALINAIFASPAPVAAGQTYALVITRPGSNNLQVGRRNGDCPLFLHIASSATASFTRYTGFDMVFTAFVTPPAQPPEAGDSNAPSATIASGPKDKTKKKEATFTFTGADTRVVASFQCSLDGAAFAPCTSPYSVKVKRGKHTFQVRAIDDAGNVGAPASDDWKRKKKKKK